MQVEAPYHAGELLVQERAGEEAQAVRNGSVIADSIIPGAIRFIGHQRMAVLGTVAPDGAIWASLLVGDAGFLRAPDPHTIDFDLGKMGSADADPFWANIEHDDRVGLLLIELSTRRRLRVNGALRRTDVNGLRLEVAEAYPNCPKYIQRRDLEALELDGRQWKTRSGAVPTDTHRSLIGQADTLFVATAHPTGGVDASHRGGEPGFVRWVDDVTLRVPDYPGNSMFNTLGNLSANAKAGLLFVDFDGGRTLQLTGRAEVRWHLDEPEHPTGGTGRYWDFTVDEWLETTPPNRFEWTLFERSPFNP